MYGAVDLLASEYGWNKDFILERVYPDDLIYLSRKIRIRRVDEYLVQARLIANPHMNKEDSRKFIEELISTREEAGGEPEPTPELDREGIANFKRFVKTESRFGKTKE